MGVRERRSRPAESIGPARRPLAAALIAGLLCSGCQAASSPDDLDEPLLQSFSRGSVEIVSGAERHKFSVYIADTPDERRQGLQFVESMPTDVGMLFISESPGRQSMWMKNTVLSLDMLFIDANGVIDRVAANTTPKSLKSVASQGLVCCVLELNAGTAKSLGITAGDRVIHSHFAAP